jgi:hypothetical protein
MLGQPMWLRAQYLRLAEALRVKVWYVIGVARRARPVGPR